MRPDTAMTLLDSSESSTKGVRRRRNRIVAAIQLAIAVFQARKALARITRPKFGSIDDIPDHLRRDLGFPEAGPRWPGDVYDPSTSILAYLRLK
jgi:hypothetical protein